MFFDFTEEQLMVQDMAKRFAREEIAPTLEKEEKNHEFKAERVRKMGELGFFGCRIPEALGGLVASAVQHAEPGAGADGQ